MEALLSPAKAEDAEQIVRVLRSSRLRFLPYAPPVRSEVEDLKWVRGSLIPSGGVTIANIEGSVVGVIATSRSNAVSWIDQLYIAPEHCGQGIGTQLMRSALDSLPRPIRAYTFQESHGARRFYERSGFRAIALGDGSQNEERCPDVLFEFAQHNEQL